MTFGLVSDFRLIPNRTFPRYAYLPGRFPHPVRDPRGHSYQVYEPPLSVTIETALSSDPYRWGVDLFNHGYYWEAHEAWEPLWLAAKQSTSHLLFFKGLILLAAAGVKIREGKLTAARRHAGRAASLFRQVAGLKDREFCSAIGISLPLLAKRAETEVESMARTGWATGSTPEPVFGFRLVPDDESP
jgi:uncharacterized protein